MSQEKPKKINRWSHAELRDAVKAYAEMLDKEQNDKPFVKKAYYRKLSEKHGRSDKSFEYRMQNISFVYDEMGKERLKGLAPASNVGKNVVAEIKSLINKYG